MVEIKHIRQSNDGINWKCGAACLEMIFNYYGIPCNQNTIWEAIKCRRSDNRFQYFALTNSLAEYAINQGLNATIHKSDSEKWSSELETIDQLSIPAILSVKNKAGKGHFVVFLGIKNGKYIFCDPDSPKETDKYEYLQVRQMWSPCGTEVKGFVYIVFEKAG